MALTAAEVQILLTAKDQASGVLRNASKEAGGLGKVLGGALKVGAVAGAAALVAVGAGAVASVKAAGDAQEMLSKFNVVFGRYAADSTASLTELAKATGRSKFDLMEMASALQDTFVPLGFARGEAAGLSEAMTALAVDVGSFNNVASTDVMRDFQSAIVGNHETVRKYGIVITQAALDTELLNMGIEGGVSAATEQEKVMARLNLIYAGTTDAQGDAARTAGSWANQMVSLKAVLGDTSKEIGLALLPALEPLLGKLVDFAQVAGPALTDFLTNKAIPAISNMSAAVGDTLGPVMDGLAPIFQNVIATVGPIIQQVIGWFRDELPGALQELGAFFGPTFDRLAEGFAGFTEALEPIMPMIDKAMPYIQKFGEILGGAVLLAIKGLAEAIAFLLPYIGENIAAAVALAIDVFGGMVTFLEGAIQMIVGLFTGDMDMAREGAQKVIDGIVMIFTGLGEFLQQKVENTVAMVVGLFAKMGIDLPATVDTMIQAVAGFFTNLGTSISETVSTTVQSVLGFFTGLNTSLSQTVSTTVQAVVGFFTKLGTDVSAAVDTMIKAVVEFFESLYDDVMGIFNDLIEGITALFDPDTWVEIGAAMMEGIKSGIESMAQVLVDAAVKAAEDAVSAVKGWLGIKSPSTVMAEIGRMMGEGMAMGIRDTAHGVSEAGHDILSGAFFDWFNYFKNTLPGFRGKTHTAFKDWIRGVLEDFTTTGSTTMGEVTSQIYDRMIQGMMTEGGTLTIAAKQMAGQKDKLLAMLGAGADVTFGELVNKAGEYMTAASTFGGLGGTAASLLEQRQLGPQREKIKALEEQLALLKEQGASLAEQAKVSAILTAERKDLKSVEADIAALAKQQADLQFLQQQSNLITMIRDQGLNAKDILGGLKLGLGADLQGVIQAMTRAMQEMIKAAETELGIASPSKRFAKMGQQALAGFGLGALAGAPGAAGQVQQAIDRSSHFTIQPTVYASRGSITVTDEIRMLQMLRVGA